jgi:acyl-coenzyme A thioesterase PaaI-like protein
MDLDVDREKRSVMRYFNVAQREIGDFANGEVVMEGTAPVLAHLAPAPGVRGVRGGALLAMVDQVGGLCGGLASLPDGWVVSTNLAARVATLEHVGPLRLHADVLRRGRAAVVNRVQVFDDGAGGAAVADAVLTSAVLVPESGPPVWQRPIAIAPDVIEEAAPAGEWLQVRAVDDRAITFDLRDELRNPWGILHGAVMSLTVDEAALHAVRSHTGDVETPRGTADLVLHFLAPGRVGPIVARGDVLGERPDGHVVRVEVRDLGLGDRVLAVAVATVRVL